jgi:hypothetical protein
MGSSHQRRPAQHSTRLPSCQGRVRRDFLQEARLRYNTLGKGSCVSGEIMSKVPGGNRIHQNPKWKESSKKVEFEMECWRSGKSGPDHGKHAKKDLYCMQAGLCKPYPVSSMTSISMEPSDDFPSQFYGNHDLSSNGDHHHVTPVVQFQSVPHGDSPDGPCHGKHGKKLLQKKLFLVCCFCRGRKILCHPKNNGGEDKTCM